MLVFSPSDENPLFKTQMEEVTMHKPGMKERDMVVFELLASSGKSSDQSAVSAKMVADLRSHYGVGQNDFKVILIGKDGGEKLRKAEVLYVDELYPFIDAMPMRRQEMKKKSNQH